VTQVLPKLRRPRDEVRNNPGSRDDFDVIGPDGKIIGRIFRPGGGARDRMRALEGRRPAAAARPRLR